MKSQINHRQGKIGLGARTLWIAYVAVIAASTIISAPQAFGQLITAGSLQVVNVSAANFTLFGGGSAANGFLHTGSIYVPGNFIGIWCNPCGNHLTINGGGSGLDFLGGTALTWLPGNVYPHINWGPFEPGGPSRIFLSGPDIPINGPGTYMGTFSYDAALCGQVVPRHLTCDVTMQVQHGSGQVMVDIAQDPHTGFLFTTFAIYLF